MTEGFFLFRPQGLQASASANSKLLTCSKVLWVIMTQGFNLVLQLFFSC